MIYTKMTSWLKTKQSKNDVKKEKKKVCSVFSAFTQDKLWAHDSDYNNNYNDDAVGRIIITKP